MEFSCITASCSTSVKIIEYQKTGDIVHCSRDMGQIVVGVALYWKGYIKFLKGKVMCQTA